MSIKGYFSEISFAELLKIISKYNGRLGVWNFQEKKQYECFFQNESVVYININGQNVLDANVINSFLSDISCDKQSYYAFQKDAILDSKPQMNLAVSKILSTSVLTNTKTEEIEQNLPNPLTKFERDPSFSGELSGGLNAFWDLSVAHLHMGCSPSELANLFGMELKEVQTNFYKLRMVRAIRPVRLFNVSKVSAKARLAGTNLQRIVNLRNGGKVHPAPTTGFSPQVSSNQVSISISEINKVKPKDPALDEMKSFDNFELDKAMPIPNNDHFINNYVHPDSAISSNDGQGEIVEETTAQKEELNNVVVPDKQPIFDLNSNVGRQGIVRRMLSSLFSRKVH